MADATTAPAAAAALAPPAAAPAPAPAPANAGKKSGKIGKIVLLVLVLLGVAFLQKAMVFALLAMLPSFIAFFLDHDPRKPVFFTITAFNFSGLFPFFMQMLMSESLSYEAEEMIANMQAWAVIYGAAGIGWLLVLAGPTISLSLVEFFYNGKATRLELEQKKLAETWGIGEESGG